MSFILDQKYSELIILLNIEHFEYLFTFAIKKFFIQNLSNIDKYYRFQKKINLFPFSYSVTGIGWEWQIFDLKTSKIIGKQFFFVFIKATNLSVENAS